VSGVSEIKDPGASEGQRLADVSGVSEIKDPGTSEGG
jgi:hypothetical protein